MAIRTSAAAKMLGISNKTLVLFFSEKHPEFEINDPLKHHGKSFSWFPEDGHTMEEEIGAELEAFFQEHPELDRKTKSEKAPGIVPVSPILAPAPIPSVVPKTPVATPAPMPQPVARPIAPISKREIKSLFRRHKEQPWNEVFAKLQYVDDGDFNRPFRELANLAENELWNFEREEFRNKYDEFYILKNYLNYTFLRVLEQDRIVFSEDHKRFCFNTGLLTKRGKDIYASFFFHPKNGLPEWTLWGFTDEFERLPVPSTKLPPPASYYEGSEAVNLVFDLSYEIAIDFEHILEENRERFPEKYRDDAILEYALKGAVASLKERIRRNYKIAIPHWYNNKLQLLLPLSLSGSDADLALVADRNDETKLYKIVTVLAMDMAYIDARLICRPDKEWLNP